MLSGGLADSETVVSKILPFLKFSKIGTASSRVCPHLSLSVSSSVFLSYIFHFLWSFKDYWQQFPFTTSSFFMTLRGIYTHLQSSTHLKQRAPYLTSEPSVSADPSPPTLPRPPCWCDHLIPKASVTLTHWKFCNSSTGPWSKPLSTSLGM